jgi:hypothetical protein
MNKKSWLWVLNLRICIKTWKRSSFTRSTSVLSIHFRLFFIRIKNGHFSKKNLIANFHPLNLISYRNFYGSANCNEFLSIDDRTSLNLECSVYFLGLWYPRDRTTRISPVRSFNCSFKYIFCTALKWDFRFSVPINWLRWIELKFRFYFDRKWNFFAIEIYRIVNSLIIWYYWWVECENCR